MHVYLNIACVCSNLLRFRFTTRDTLRDAGYDEYMTIWSKTPQTLESYRKRGLKWTDARDDPRVIQTQWRYRNICIIISRYNGNYEAQMWHMWSLKAWLIKTICNKNQQKWKYYIYFHNIIISLDHWYKSDLVVQNFSQNFSQNFVVKNLITDIETSL